MIQLLAAKPEDALRLSEFAAQVFRETFGPHNSAENLEAYIGAAFTEEKLREEILDPIRRTTLAISGDELVGYTQLAYVPPDIAAEIAAPVELVRLYVHSGWHGRGISHDLMLDAMMAAKLEERETLWLGVWERNGRALAFYRKWGFTEAGSHIFQMGDDPQRDLILVKSLDGASPLLRM
jgi:GNAT superfamily N-acetyltransferase